MDKAQKLSVLRASILNLAAKIKGSPRNYVNVTSSRILGGLYTNSTKETVTVFLSVLNSTGSTAYLDITVDNKVIGQIGGVNSSSLFSANVIHQVSFEVPPGKSYKIARINNFTINKWWELRA